MYAVLLPIANSCAVCRGIQQTTILVNKLKELGVDLVDTSSGGNFVGQKVTFCGFV